MTRNRYDACGWKRQEGRVYVRRLGYGQLTAITRDGTALIRMEDAPRQLEMVNAGDWTQDPQSYYCPTCDLSHPDDDLCADCRKAPRARDLHICERCAILAAAF